MSAVKHNGAGMGASEIDSELRKLSSHQKALIELEEVLRQVAVEGAWKETRIADALLELEQRINAIERRVQMLLIEAARDDKL
jgi:uncharacterized protein with PhoU and TrkA domain